MKCIVTKGSIHYEIEGTGLPIVIMHSMGTDHRSMKSWLEPVFEKSEGFQRIYIDIPVHGHSSINENFKSSDDMLSNILEFIDKILPNKTFSLIGFSYGGYLAQGVLHHKRNKVKSICLLATALHSKTRNLPNKITITKDTELLKKLDDDSRKAFETLMIYQDIERYHLFLEEIQPGRLLANRDFLLSNWRENGYFLSEVPFAEIDEFSQSASILVGKQDAICGYKDHLKLLEKFPHGTYAVLDQAGHMLHIDQREIVQGLIQEWLVRTLSVVN
ncbi:pimeloyl-ACP methyl ester carboxylesterase [Metabacillus crassostreae]|uniref:alpha/beta fold hydrolase n=1 Tax=Metabacillus crassostreae TaxID=929098 RepID=UPI00195C8350|nr:alpha/beta hydrolase [Metabacillus crassostreae]MBM7602292.1 pimeloyl-ACP methyl ester carboxylesterase [Metabacillus crassostreae]